MPNDFANNLWKKIRLWIDLEKTSRFRGLKKTICKAIWSLLCFWLRYVMNSTSTKVTNNDIPERADDESEFDDKKGWNEQPAIDRPISLAELFQILPPDDEKHKSANTRMLVTSLKKTENT